MRRFERPVVQENFDFYRSFLGLNARPLSSPLGKSFAVETTFSGIDYSNRINNWKSAGYYIIVYYLKLQSVELAIERVKLRVSKGGHNIPEDVIKRRYERGWYNFQHTYKYLADVWTIFDNSGRIPVILDESTGQEDGL